MKKFSAFGLALVILLASCNDKDGDKDVQPVLPPASSMSPDFESFSDESGPDGGRVHLIKNWVYAATSVGIYSAVLTGALAVPVTAFKLAVDQQASYDEENELWVWQYDISIPRDASYKVKLTANVDGSDVTWTGYISKNGGFTDFVWFTGASDVEAKSGSWTLFESPENPSPWLSAEWSKSEVDGVANVIFEVEKAGDNLGSSISYEVNTSSELNRKVVIVDTKADNNIDVQWNHEEKFGRIKSVVFFENDLYHCWDSSLNDVDCE